MQTTEKIDPLKRIQEEIQEVVRREQEYKQMITGMTSPTKSLLNEKQNYNFVQENNDEQTDIDVLIDNMTSLVIDDNNSLNSPSLTSSVHSKESLDEHHSDDSGISAASSITAAPVRNKEQRYIGPNCYNLTPEPPQQKMLTRTISTQPINAGAVRARQINFNPGLKGMMQRFISSRGKLQLSNNRQAASQDILLNGKSAAALMGLNSPNIPTPGTPSTNNMLMPEFGVRNNAAILMPPIIERDSEGRPIRPGFVPVELKIQRELKDLKSRESELKKIRKIRQSTPNLLNSIDNDNVETDDEDESEVEHCYGPNKLRSAKSINDMCDFNQTFTPSFDRTTPSPDFDAKYLFNRSVNNTAGMRPAMSLAQLCDLDPQEAPSSHRLIAQWESLIQQNA